MALGACAPTTASPMIIRMDPLRPNKNGIALGARTGPRLSTALPGNSTTPIGTHLGDDQPMSLPQLGVAYDVAFTTRITEDTAFHLGLQGVFYYPLPFPAYGVYLGASHYFTFGQFSFAPALLVRGSTDFGIPASIGGPASLVGTEASFSLAYHPLPNVTVGVVPFIGYHRIYSRREASAFFTGGVLALRFNNVELTGGFGRVFMPGFDNWTVPIMGARGGE
jgi:hypothetical protein